jgi:hypothetical protein
MFRTMNGAQHDDIHHRCEIVAHLQRDHPALVPWSGRMISQSLSFSPAHAGENAAISKHSARLLVAASNPNPLLTLSRASETSALSFIGASLSFLSKRNWIAFLVAHRSLIHAQSSSVSVGV